MAKKKAATKKAVKKPAKAAKAKKPEPSTKPAGGLHSGPPGMR